LGKGSSGQESDTKRRKRNGGKEEGGKMKKAKGAGRKEKGTRFHTGTSF